MNWDAVRTLDFVEDFRHFETLASTNDFALSLPYWPSKGLAVIVAESQSQGRGQRGNSFFSSVPGGLYCSLMMPLSDLSNHFKINRGLSCAIAEALALYAPQTAIAIKWPNDIYCNQKKICGILLERAGKAKVCIVVGFGINVNLAPEQFPAEIASIATSLLCETKQEHDPVALCRAILLNLWENLQADETQVHAQYTARLYGLGAPIEINGYRGVFSGVEQDGRLCLVRNGTTAYFTSGSPRFL